MNGIELLGKGDLAAALEAQTAAVKAQPTNVDHRYNLAAMLVLRGDLDRAEKHLATIGSLQSDLHLAVTIMLSLLQAEEERRRVYAGQGAANIPPETRDDLQQRRLLRRQLSAGDDAGASTTFAALPDQPSGPCTIDGKPFARLRDADETLGDVLEVFVGGRYLWWPFAQIEAIEFTAPRGLLDFIWLPCTLSARNGRRAQMHVPAVYAGSLGHADAQVARAHRTEWLDEGGVAFRGLGQRLLSGTDAAGNAVELPLLELRQLRFA